MGHDPKALTAFTTMDNWISISAKFYHQLMLWLHRQWQIVPILAFWAIAYQKSAADRAAPLKKLTLQNLSYSVRVDIPFHQLSLCHYCLSNYTAYSLISGAFRGSLSVGLIEKMSTPPGFRSRMQWWGQDF